MMDRRLRPKWRRIVVRAVAAGGGFAVVFSVVCIAFAWYQNRPAPDVWTSGGISADYSHFDVATSDSTYFFYYVLHNPSKHDFVARDHTIFVCGRSNVGAMIDCKGWFATIEPIFIPAGESLEIRIHFNHPFPLTVHDTYGDEEGRRMLHQAELGHLKDELPRLVGLVLFDQTSKVKIELPGGWRNEVIGPLP